MQSKNIAIAVLHFLFFSARTFSQTPNLVPNGDFESGTCGQVGPAIGNFSPWYSVGPNHTIDAFGRCGNTPGPGGGCCKGGIGMFVRGNGTNSVPVNFAECIEVKLTQPLAAGQTYCVEFYAATRRNAGGITFVPVDKLGAYFSTTNLTGLDTMATAYTSGGSSKWILDKVKPQVQNTAGNWITQNSCVKISGSFVAAGGEQYMVIGNFNTAANTPCQNGTDCISYLVIDNVSVIAGSCTPLAVSTVTASSQNICTGQCTSLSATVTGGSGTYTYVWQPGGSSGSTVSVCPTANTTYSLTVSSPKGCTPETTTSTISVNVSTCSGTPAVTVNSSSVCTGQCTSVTASVTGGSSPYTYAWNTGATAQTISVCPSATTIYTVTITDAGSSAATSTATVSISPPPAASITSPVTVCSGSNTALTASGGTTYSWLPGGSSSSSITVSPSSTTTYSAIVSNASGCTTIVTTTVNVAPGLTPSTTSALICPGGSAVITASGGSGYSWNTGAQTSSTAVSPSATTVYTVYITSGSCSTTATATVTVNTGITASITGGNSVCAGSSTTLTATGGSTFSWSINQSTGSIVVTPTSTTTYSLWASSGTCKDSTSITVTVNPLPSPTATSATVCAGGTATLTASGGNSYSWIPTGGTSPSIIVSPSATTSYTLIATGPGGCKATATTSVTVNPAPTPSIAGGTTICSGSSASLTASGGNSYSWNTGITGPSITVTPSLTTIYTVTATSANGCTATTTSTVSVTQPPVGNISGNKSICAGSSAVLTATGGGTYVWSTTETTASISVSPSGTTTYSVLVSIGTCTAAASFTITTVAPPVAGAQSNVVINIGDQTTLTATGSPDGVYSWIPSTGLSCSNCSNPVASPEMTTDYCVYVTNGICMDSACVTVTVEYNCHPVYLPNAFSPNGDFENDVLYVYGNCIKEMKFIIYNRWGEKVYESTNPKEGWDGYFRGEPENAAVYAYYLEYTLYTGARNTKRGNVSLIR